MMEKIICLFQREFATVQKDQANYIGSYEATSCNILILRSASTGKVSCAHIDGESKQIGGTQCSINMMLLTFTKQERDDAIQVYLAVGFLDEKGLSKEISSSILEALQKHSTHFEIQLACTGKLNNEIILETINSPLVRGISIELSSGIVFPCDFEEDGLTPEQCVRNIRFTSSPALANIYNSERDLLIIEPFNYRPISPYEIKFFQNMPDHELLQRVSTTPLVESPNFVVNFKKSLVFWQKYPKSADYFRGKTLEYSYDRCSKEWKITN